jgi:Glycosyl hydrolases family 18
MASLTEYVGADPNGMPPPDLTTVPRGSDVFELRFALAFALDDGSGNFQPGWDQSLTPSLIAQVKQSTGATFVASLAGANSPWNDPPDVQGWVDNATSSLWNLVGTYGLAGIDVDYEGGVDGTFATAISQVLNNLRSRASLQLSIAPFGQTWPVYQQVVSNVGPTEMLINYQAYADGLTDQQSYLDLYANLAQFVESVTPPGVNMGGYYDLALGINSDTQRLTGLQPPDIYSVLTSLQGNGIGTAFVWSAEWSAPSGFSIENNIVNIFSG